MSSVLLDTNVAAFFHSKRKDSPQRALYAPDVAGHQMHISVHTYAELLAWPARNNWSNAERVKLQHWLARTFVVLPIRETLAFAWVEVTSIAIDRGRRLEDGDAWIAATALFYRLPLLTHDRDFDRLGVAGLTVICHAPE